MPVDQKPKKDINKFAAGMMRLFSVQAVGLGCGFLVHLILASQLGAVEYGIYNFVFSVSMVCALLGNFGFQASAVRLIPQIMSDQKSDTLKQFFCFTSVWIFILSSVISIGAFQLLMMLDFAAQYPKNALLIGIGLTPLLALLKLNSGILKGFKEGAWALAYESSLKEILFFLVLACALLISLSFFTAQITLLMTATILACLFMVSVWHIMRLMSSQVKLLPASLSGNDNKQAYKSWLRISFPMMLVISVQYLIIRSDVLMLGILSNPSDIGVYSAGAKIAQAATIGMMVLNILFSPRAAELYHQGKHLALKNIYFKTLKLQAFTTIGLVFIVAFSSKFIIAYLGADYSAAQTVIYVLLAGYCVNCFWGPVPFLMIMTRYEYEAMWLTFAAVFLNIALNIVLIPLYGIVGAAVSTVITINLRNGTAFFYILSKGLFSKQVHHE